MTDNERVRTFAMSEAEFLGNATSWQELERRAFAGQAAADMRLAADAQVEKARHGLADGVPAMEVAAMVAAAFTSLVEANTYEQAAAHERTREHTRTNDEGESHDEA